MILHPVKLNREIFMIAEEDKNSNIQLANIQIGYIGSNIVGIRFLSIL
jgi:hypothetical protein